MKRRGPQALGFHSLGFKLFGALAVFVAVPTILLVSLSDFSLRSTITEEIGKSAVGKLRVAHSIETILDDLVKNLGMRITMNPDLKALSEVRRHATITAGNQYAYRKYLEVLDDSVQTNPLLRSIEIVFEDADYVLSTAGGVVARDRFDDEAWLAATTREQGFEGNGTFLPPHVPSAADGPVLSYYFPFPPYLTDLRGAVILHVYEREFSRMVNNPDHGTEGTVTLVDDEGRIVSDVDKAQVGRPWQGWNRLAVSEGQGVVTVGRPDGDHLVTWYRPDRGAWTYVGDFPLAALTRNVGTVRLVTALLSLAVVVVGVVLSYVLARRFFHPVRRLIRDLNRRLGTDEDAEGNELGLLSGAFDLLLKRETQLFHDLESQQRARDQEWVGRTLRGEGEALAGERPRELRGGLLFSGTLLVDGFLAFTQNFPPEQREYLRSVLLHMAEQVFLPEITCLGTVADPRSLSLLLATDLEDGGAFADRVDEGFERLSAEASRLLGTSITLCLGTRGSGGGHWEASAAEASALVNQRFLHGPGHWFWAENTCEGDTPFFPLKAERALLNALEAGDTDAASQALDELRQVLQASRGLGYDNALLILHQLVGGIVKHLVERRIDLTTLFGRGDLHRTLSEAETLDEALTWLRGVLGRVFDQGPAPEGYVPRMIRFIRGELHRDFGVEDVAAAAGLSYSHARRVFEDEMGESIVEYTNALRVEEAKRLLTATGASLDEIAVLIGYNNVQSFQRYFKKLAGVTPGGYRVRQK